MVLGDEILMVINTPRSKVHLLKGDVIRIEPNENVEFEVKDLEEIQKVKFQMVGERRHAVLFVTPSMGEMTKEARAFSASPSVNKNAVAKAIVIKNLGMRMVSSFFIRFNKPSIEHRIFDKEAEALLWLRSELDATAS